MPPHTIAACPDCDLVLRVARNDLGSTLIYGVTDWQRRCKHPHLGNLAWYPTRWHASKEREVARSRARSARLPTAKTRENLRFQYSWNADGNMRIYFRYGVHHVLQHHIVGVCTSSAGRLAGRPAS